MKKGVEAIGLFLTIFMLLLTVAVLFALLYPKG